MPDPSGRPEDIRFISGVLLVSSQPERLMEFYRDVLGLPLTEERHGDTEPLCYPPADLGAESRITAVRDPDGNLVELTQLGRGWLGHLKARRAEGNDLVTRWSAHLGQIESARSD